ncbi:MAG: ACT domain-containing protein [Vulcanimicrobiota bacterium]
MRYLLTVNGDDKKGLVEALATSIQGLGGNWLQSRLCRLEGQFAGIVSVEFVSRPTDLPGQVESLNCSWKEYQSADDSGRKVRQANIRILAADRPGIIKQISHVLAGRGANVEEVESHIRSAPFSGERMFEAHYTISIDGDTDENDLRDGLESLAEELMCDLDYKAD